MFKNLVFYRVPAGWSSSAADVEDKLAARPLRPCGPFDLSTSGWVAVTHGGRLLHSVNRQHMIALGVNEKLLPASIVRQVAQERADAEAKIQGFPVGRGQMRELRARVADELRARALTRCRVTRAWLDERGGWFAVDASSLPRAEMLVEVLGDTLGSFAPRIIETERSPHAAMTAWLVRGEAPINFSIDDELELQTADTSKTVIRYSRHPLDGKEIRGYLGSGKFPTRLGLTWRDRVSFVLTNKLQVKRLDFLETSETVTETSEEDPVAQFDAEFTLMAGELSALLDDLTAVLGSRPRNPAEWPEQVMVA